MDVRDVSVEEELRRLRRRTRALTLGLFAVAALGVLGAARPAQEVVAANRFELVDAEGRVRAELAVDADGSAGLFVRDEEGRKRLTATHDAEQSALLLWDAEGQVRVGAAQFAHGGGGFALHGPEAKGAAVLYLKGEGSLRFIDAEGVVTHQVPPAGR